MLSVTSSPVLVVEDDAAVRRTLERACRFSGRAVVAVDSGAAALSWLRDHAPSLVVLDVHLPDMNGLEVLRTLRGWLEVPVVVITGVASEGVQEHARDLGAHLVEKPFDLDTVLEPPTMHGVPFAAD
jgi:two-component system KDP operon response regulator KdpE